jgi:hypothetical protein
MGTFADIYNLREDIARMNDVAEAIDSLSLGTTTTSTVTLTGSDSATSPECIFVNNSTNITRTMPSPSTCAGKVFKYVKISNNANTCTIAAASGSIFGDYSNVLNARGDFVAYISNGANYFQLSGNVLNWTSWTPTYIPSGSMTFTSVTTDLAQYALSSNLVYIRMRFNGTIGGTLSTALGVSTPIDPNIGSFGLESGMICRINNVGIRLGVALSQGATSPRRFDITRYDFVNLTAGNFSCSISGYYLR